MGWNLPEGSASARAGQSHQHTQLPLGGDTTSLEYLAAGREPIPWAFPQKRCCSGAVTFGAGEDHTFHSNEVLLSGFAGFPT